MSRHNFAELTASTVSFHLPVGRAGDRPWVKTLVISSHLSLQHRIFLSLLRFIWSYFSFQNRHTPSSLLLSPTALSGLCAGHSRWLWFSLSMMISNCQVHSLQIYITSLSVNSLLREGLINQPALTTIKGHVYSTEDRTDGDTENPKNFLPPLAPDFFVLPCSPAS